MFLMIFDYYLLHFVLGLCDEPVHPVAGVPGGQAGVDIQPV